MDRADVPACRPCQHLRKQWEAERAERERLAAVEAAKPKPMCELHPGQFRDHCGPCRSEQIGAA